MSVYVTIYNEAAKGYLATDGQLALLSDIPFTWMLEGYTTPGRGKDVYSTITTAPTTEKAVINVDMALLEKTGAAPVGVSKKGVFFQFGGSPTGDVIPITLQDPLIPVSTNPSFLTVLGSDLVVSFLTGDDEGKWKVSKVALSPEEAER